MDKLIIEFEIQKQINLQDNDILIVECEKMEHLEAIGRAIREFFPNKNIMLVSTEGIADLEIVDEETMKRFGWKRIDGFTKRT